MIFIRSTVLLWLLSFLAMLVSMTSGALLASPALMVRSYHEEANYYTWIDPRTTVFQESPPYPVQTFISPNGQWLMWEDKSRSGERMSIFVAPYSDPENWRLLAEYDQSSLVYYDTRALWTGNSQDIVLTTITDRDGTWFTETQRVNVSTGSIELVGECPLFGEHATLSPDGRYIMLSYIFGQTIGIVDLQKGTCHLIENAKMAIERRQTIIASVFPIWSPDSRFVYYTTEGNISYNLVLNAYDMEQASSQVISSWLLRPYSLFPSMTYMSYYTQLGQLVIRGNDSHYELDVGRLSAAAWSADDRYFAYAVENLRPTIASSSIYIFEPESGATWKIGQVRGAAREIKWMGDS